MYLLKSKQCKEVDVLQHELEVKELYEKELLQKIADIQHMSLNDVMQELSKH